MKNTKADKKIAEKVSEFIVKTKYDDLPRETIEKVKIYIIDFLGCAVAASREPQAQALLEVVKEEGGKPRCTVIAHGFKTSTMNAALLNGSMGHILDFDDDHREGTMHPSVAVFRAVFALGEKNEVNGKALIRAFI